VLKVILITLFLEKSLLDWYSFAFFSGIFGKFGEHRCDKREKCVNSEASTKLNKCQWLFSKHRCQQLKQYWVAHIYCTVYEEQSFPNVFKIICYSASKWSVVQIQKVCFLLRQILIRSFVLHWQFFSIFKILLSQHS